MKYFSLLICFFLCSCAQLFQNRTFVDQMEEDDGLFRAGDTFEAVPGDSGQVYRDWEAIKSRTPATSRERMMDRQEVGLRSELSVLEAQLTFSELSDYEEFKEINPNPSARVYFLGLDPEGRKSFLSAQRGDETYTSSVYRGVSSIGIVQERSLSPNQVHLGMQKQEVLGNWGQPTYIDHAGKEGGGNERWTFINRGQTKTVYFQEGLVEGWSLD